jgi:hypothetical protein
MRILALACIFVLLTLFCAAPAPAQKIELFGGYSLVHAPVAFDQTGPGLSPTTRTTPTLNLNGWEASGALKVFGPVALVADFNGTRGSFHGASTHLNTYLFGPQLRLPGPVSLFGHALLGTAHQSIRSGVSGGVITSGPTQDAFGTAIGGGLDLHVLPFISLRVLQVDYLYTHFNSKTQNQPRVSAGLVLHF